MHRILVVAALVLGGCPKKPAAVVPAVVEVRVVDRTPSDPALPRPDVAALTQVAARTIGASGLPVTDGGAQPGALKLRVEVRLDGAEDASTQKGVMRAFVEARLSPVGGEPGALSFEQAAVAERVYELKSIGDRASAFRAHAARAVEDVVRGVGQKAQLSRGPASELVKALGGSDEDLRDEAIRLAADRREPTAVPPLIAMLKSDDRALRDRAIGALAAIGDARAVRPLTEVARFRDVADLPKVLDALSAIGGDEARAYLEFVASGHESPEMRELAKEALGRLDRRRRDLSVK